MIGDNVESLREYIADFQPNTMTAMELKELLSGSSTSSLASIPSNSTSTSSRFQSSTSSRFQSSTTSQYNPAHSFRCGYCKFSSANSGDVKKHQTWKHANLVSNILPIDPTDQQQQQQGTVGFKRKRVQSSKITSQDDDEPLLRRQRISMPTERKLIIDTNAEKDSTPKG